jgi:DNA-binding CsgD family transcriptional regulator
VKTLTAHQLDTLRLYKQLGSYEAVADFRGVQVATIGNTLKIIRQKLDVHTTAEAVEWLARQGAA